MGYMSNLERAYKSLLSLSVGDAFGENSLKIVPPRNLTGKTWDYFFVPPRTWDYFWTDDTHEAKSVYQCLEKFGCIDCDWLIQKFVSEYIADPQRGYGKGTVELFRQIHAGGNWQELAPNMFGPGKGSYGNGGAMRSAVIGAYFGFENIDKIEFETLKATKISHDNKDAIDGATAVALAASAAGQTVNVFWNTLSKYLQNGPVKNQILKACYLNPKTDIYEAAKLLGTGLQVSALDTVPLSLWLSSIGLLSKDFTKPMKMAVSVAGDTDTICAIVGGIIGPVVEPPSDWIAKTEPLGI